MRAKTKLPRGLYRRKNRAGEELPTVWCWYYVPGRPQPLRESTGTTDIEAALRFRHARLAETGQMRAQRQRAATVRVHDLLTLVVRDYADQGQVLPPGVFEALNHALGHLRAVEDVDSPLLDDLCRRWRRHGIRWHKDAAGVVTERPTDRVRPVSASTCNRYVAFLRRGYSLARRKLGLAHPALTFPQYNEPKNPHPIPAEVLAEIFPHLAPEPRAKLLRFLLLSGARVGQVLRTRVAQFTAGTGTIHWNDEDTKQGLPHVVTYTGEALAILRWFLAYRDPACPALFQEKGAALTKDKLDQTWARACRAAGVPLGRRAGGFVIHDLRHSFVSDAHDAGLSAGVIMAFTGHVQEPTMYRYLRVSAPAQEQAQAQLEAHRRTQAARVAARRARVVPLVPRRAAG